MADQTLPGDRGAAARPAPPRVRRPGDPADRTLAIGLGIVATLVGLLALAWLVLYVTKGRFLKGTFESVASRMAEREIRVAGDFQFYFDIIDAHFRAEGLTVANPSWAPRPHFFAARLIDARIKTLSLIFGGERRAETLLLDGAEIDAEWDAKRRNTWTFGDPDEKGEPFQMPVIEREAVTDTKVRYVDPSLFLVTDVNVGNVSARDTRVADGRIGFDGSGTLRGKRFTMDGAILSPNSTLALGRTRLELRARSGPTRLDLSGVLPAATQIVGSNLDLTVRGPNLRLLFDFLGVAVPDTRGYRFRSDLTKDAEGAWKFTRLRGIFGSSDLAGRMTITMPADRLKIDADVASRFVDIVDVGPFIGYEPQALATTGVQAAVAAGGGAPQRILPDAPLRVEAIKAFDAHVVYKVRDVKQPFLPLSNIALTFDLDRSLMTLSPLTMTVADSGHLASDIRIDARGARVITDYDIRLAPTPLNKLFRSTGFFNNGTTGSIKARVQMKGTGDTLHDSLATSNGRIALIFPRGTFWTQYAQLAEFDIGLFLQKLLEDQLKKPIEVNCGLVAFTVRNGIATADPIIIDTDKNVMLARGSFSFRDESMDLAFRADGKKFSLFSGQSPVGIGGRFAAPSIQIVSPQLIARGAAGAGLAVAAGPVGAVLAFVDPGDAKGAQCGPVLRGATAAAQRTTKGERRDDVGAKPKKEKKFLGIL